MLATMVEAFSDVHPLLGFVVKWTFISIVILICWVLASVLFGLLYRAFTNTSKGVSEYLKVLANRNYNRSESIRNSLSTPYNQFVQLHNPILAFHRQKIDVKRFFQTIRQQVNSFMSDTSRTLSNLQASVAGLSSSVDSLNAIELPKIDKLPEPNIDVERDLFRRKRRAKTFLVIGSIGLVFLLFLNTAMLDQFFKSIIPGYLFPELFGPVVRLSMLIAFFFTILEVFLGVGHFYFFSNQNRVGENMRANLLELLFYLLIACLAFFEMFLYLLLSLEITGKTLSDLPNMEWYDLLFSVWMSPFGLVIVCVLVVIGHILIESIDSLRDADYGESLKKEVRRLNSLVGRLESRSNIISENVDKLETANSEFDKKLNPKGKGQKTNVLTLDFDPLNSAIESAGEKTEQINQKDYEQITTNESKLIYYQELFYFVVAVASLFVFFYLQNRILSNVEIFKDVSPSIFWIMSLLQVVALLGSTHLFTERISFHDSEDQYKTTSMTRQPYLVVIGMITILGVIGFNVFAVNQVNDSVTFVLFLLLLASCGALLWVGIHLEPMLHAVWCLCRMVAWALTVLLIWIFSALLIIISSAFGIIGSSLYVLGYPALNIYEYIKEKNSQKITSF